MLTFNSELTLVTCAFDGEIDLLRDNSNFPNVKAMGIGNLEQAVQVFDYLTQNPNIKQIVFLGSCGVYPWSQFQIKDIVSPDAVYANEIAASLGFAKQLPMDPLFYPLQNDPTFPNGVCNAPTCITLHELNDPPESSWKEFAIENLELFGLAKVANIFKIPITAYLVVTNRVGPNGSFEWQSNWREFSNHLQNTFLKL
ncbi:phosphorylase [Leptospira bouyouniensis]|uniref:Phosphorylase n=1 Tax=Leptospira bouyouniensis TaxID=2484911 RepID=A0ABY2L2B6_9LEPT|nr:phosphorylase [Leptospira bouyouniensis]TGK48077.1 phosphorylase [Leptospira bouyouniensis]